MVTNDEPLAQDLIAAIEPHFEDEVLEAITLVAHKPASGGLRLTVVGCYGTDRAFKKELVNQALTLM